MGSHLVPTPYLVEVQEFLGTNWTLGCSVGPAEGGVLFSNPSLSDAECAALFVGFVQSWPAGLEQLDRPLPPAVRSALDTLMAINSQQPASMNDAQTATAVKALITVLRWTNRRIEE